MSTRDWAGVFFLLDGTQIAFRGWTCVPRVGETVVFASHDARPFRVVRVLWREERSTDTPYAEVELVDPALTGTEP